MASDNSPGILDLCETFLQKNNPDSQISINGFNVLRKDRSDTQEKHGGGLLLHSRQSLNIKRRTDIEFLILKHCGQRCACLMPSLFSFALCTTLPVLIGNGQTYLKQSSQLRKQVVYNLYSWVISILI